jgi:hypothetical protein
MKLNPRMARRIATAGLPVLLFLALPSTGFAQAIGAGLMPKLSAEDLNERAVTLPAQLPAEKTLVLMAFTQEQQADLDTWITGLGLVDGKLPWIETPVIEKSNAFVRAMISGGMRRGIPDKSVRERTITLFTDPVALRREMGLPGDGKVVW